MKYFRNLVIFSLILLMFWGCGKSRKWIKDISLDEIEAHIRFLSDDLLEGRLVGSKGLATAALYQENFFRGLGLDPAFGNEYRQPFDLKGTMPDKNASLEVFSENTNLQFNISKDFVLGSEREDCPYGVEGELVYCGYLIQAPERNWNDIKNIDLKGKVLLVEVNEPGNYPGGIFDGEDMTYYGRWTYKFEKASQLGATGILIIHNTKGAAYGWEVVQNSWAGESFFLPDKENNLFFHGWIHGDAAEKILNAAGLDRIALAAQAEKEDFKPVPLGLSVRVRQKSEFYSVSTVNISAILKGKNKKVRDQYVILSAHYDHLGRDPQKEGDQIYNGAVDNCSASASMLSLARYYSQCPEALRVNLVFVAVTAEEEGLLGSDYFVRHLPFPKSSVLANLNFEMTNVWGETEDVYSIGGRHSDLDDICRLAAERIDLRYIPERGANFGFFFRSDQLSFARAGIPAVWLHEGITSKGEDKAFIQKKRDKYQRYRYHKVADEIEKDWDLSGTVQITRWAQEIISLLSDGNKLPRFKQSSSFRRED